MSGKTKFWQASDDYHGVLRSGDVCRLAISPNGKRYMIQKPIDGGPWVVVKARRRLSDLLPFMPSEIAAMDLADLPDDAHEYSRIWASDVAAVSDRIRKTNSSRDEYSGVIASEEFVRLVILPGRAAYALQDREGSHLRPPDRRVQRRAGPWATVRRSKRSDVIVGALMCDFRLAGSGIAARALRLPPLASDYHNRKVEKPSDLIDRRIIPAAVKGPKAG